MKKKKNYIDDSSAFYRKKEFIELQAKWYRRLKEEGFSDLEYYDQKTGRGLDLPILTGSLREFANLYSVSTQKYYECCRAYLAHKRFPSAVVKECFRLHTEGLSYHKITRKMRDKYNIKCAADAITLPGGKKSSLSIYWIFHEIKKIIPKMLKWNRKDQRGALWESPEEASENHYDTAGVVEEPRKTVRLRES